MAAAILRGFRADDHAGACLPPSAVSRFLPERMRLSRALTLRGLRSKEFFSAAGSRSVHGPPHIGTSWRFMWGDLYGAWARRN